MSEWQPIETAPKDGSWLVFANFDAAEAEYDVGRYAPYYWRSYKPVGDGLFQEVQTMMTEWTHSNTGRMTHWMPLPPPPAEACRSEEREP